MAINKALFSHDSDEWETPQWLFDKLNKEFNFNLDLAATKENAKTSMFCSKENSGLTGIFRGNFNIWCNPPYSDIKNWCKRCYELSNDVNIVVMLVPARTDTKWFHEFCYNQKNVEIRFIKGRLKFGESKNSAPFPSMIVIFRNQNGDNNGTSEN